MNEETFHEQLLRQLDDHFETLSQEEFKENALRANLEFYSKIGRKISTQNLRSRILLKNQYSETSDSQNSRMTSIIHNERVNIESFNEPFPQVA